MKQFLAMAISLLIASPLKPRIARQYLQHLANATCLATCCTGNNLLCMQPVLLAPLSITNISYNSTLILYTMGIGLRHGHVCRRVISPVLESPLCWIQVHSFRIWVGLFGNVRLLLYITDAVRTYFRSLSGLKRMKSSGKYTTKCVIQRRKNRLMRVS